MENKVKEHLQNAKLYRKLEPVLAAQELEIAEANADLHGINLPEEFPELKKEIYFKAIEQRIKNHPDYVRMRDLKLTINNLNLIKRYARKIDFTLPDNISGLEKDVVELILS